MFGNWLNRARTQAPVTPERLARLLPYARLAAADLAAAAARVERMDFPRGPIDGSLPLDRQVFLDRGSLRLKTVSGDLVAISSDSAQAGLPLPRGEQLVSLQAAEPCSFLVVPNEVAPAPLGEPAPVAPPPVLTGEETEALEKLHQHFAHGHCELPSLPDLALRIAQAIDDPRTDNDDIARLIQLDPGLTARIISVVNSAAFGGVSKITSTQQAAARLGRKKVRSLVFSCILKSIFKVESSLLKRRMEQLWQDSAYVAALAFVLGRETPGIVPEQALLAGLVHDIGAVAVIGGLNRFPALTRRETVMDHVIDRLRIEAGMQTLREWRLEQELGDVVRNASNWFRLGTAVADDTDAVILSRLHAMIGGPAQAVLPRINAVPAFSKLAAGGLTPRRSLALLEAAESDVREVRSLIGSA